MKVKMIPIISVAALLMICSVGLLFTGRMAIYGITGTVGLVLFVLGILMEMRRQEGSPRSNNRTHSKTERRKPISSH